MNNQIFNKRQDSNPQICENCLYTSENYPEIKIDDKGFCDICNANISIIEKVISNRDKIDINAFIKEMKAKKSSKYDCIIGISGGADSTFLVHLAKEWGLNPLLVHIDGGWNSEISVQNIKNLVDITQFDYYSEILNWEEMKDVQKAFINANVLDIDLPFDNLMMSYLYQIAKKQNVKYVLNGYSSETEGIMPDSFTHYKLDKRNILDIHKKNGSMKLKSLKFIGTYDFFIYEKFNKIKFYQPIDWIHYDKQKILPLIKERYNWQEYGDKHFENLFTRFYQSQILPEKFGIDKRISHLSILICSGQITKKEAIESLNKASIMNVEVEKKYFLKKLNLTDSFYENYIKTKAVSHRNYKSELDIYERIKPLYRFIKNKFGWNLFSN